MTHIRLIGVYRASVSEDELRFIAEEVTLSMQRAQEEIKGLALVEIEIRGATKEFDLLLLHQDGSDQVAWDEKYFSVDGREVLGGSSEKPDQPDFRACFFLHHFEPTKGIVSPYGNLAPSEISEMPERLARVCVYAHPG
jgi:hypothetical protein